MFWGVKNTSKIEGFERFAPKIIKLKVLKLSTERLYELSLNEVK